MWEFLTTLPVFDIDTNEGSVGVFSWRWPTDGGYASSSATMNLFAERKANDGHCELTPRNTFGDLQCWLGKCEGAIFYAIGRMIDDRYVVRRVVSYLFDKMSDISSPYRVSIKDDGFEMPEIQYPYGLDINPLTHDIEIVFGEESDMMAYLVSR